MKKRVTANFKKIKLKSFKKINFYSVIKNLKELSPKRKLRYGLIGTLLLMTIGYAAVNTSLGIEGLLSVDRNNIFKVIFTDLKIDGVDSKKYISADGESFTFNAKDIKKIGESSLDYTITNASSNYDAEVTVSCTPEFSENTTLNYNSESVIIRNTESEPGIVKANTTKGEGKKLYEQIKNQSKGNESVLNYTSISSASNGQGVYSTTNTDSGKEVYFYRGNIDNNNVRFANYCWKIIRTTETSGVKLLYNGTPTGGKCGNLSGVGIASTTYQIAGNDNAYAGYMYGKTGSSNYADTHANTNSSKLKTEIDNWYKNNLLNTADENYLEDTVWCNDRSVPTTTTGWTNSANTFNQLGYGTNKTLYGFAIRGGSYTSNTNPTLKCANANDRFTTSTSTGNGALTYPVATLTADEVIYAGATGGYVSSESTSAPNKNYYLYNANNTIWTMTPSLYSGSYIQGVSVFTHGGLSSTWTNVGAREMGVRPSISIKEGTIIASGDGSLDKPYVIGNVSSDEEITDDTEYTCKLEARMIEEEEKLIGTEYCFGNECFNVIGYDGTNYKLLAKYNLYVGRKSDTAGVNYTEILESEAGYGIQNPLALGDRGYPRYGTSAFGTSNEYSTSYVKPYVDNYVNYLNQTFNINATGRLINVEELLRIGCVLGQGNAGCSSTFNKHHEWLLKTTFWTGEKGSTANSIYLVGGDGFFSPVTSIDTSTLRGVRPVIIVPADKVNISTKPVSKIPIDWQDKGIFSDYYEKAYTKLQTMTQSEKVGQLLVASYTDTTAANNAIKNYNVGGILFFEAAFTGKTTAQVQSMTSGLQAESKTPLMMAVDEEGGRVVRISPNANLISAEKSLYPNLFFTNTNNKNAWKLANTLYEESGKNFELIKQEETIRNNLLKNLGLNINFAPVVDIATPPAYISDRSFGSDANLVAQYATEVIKAGKNSGVSHSLKHFPGYGNNSDTHSSSSIDETSMEELQKTHLVPFKEGINAGAETVMVTHNIVAALDKELPASLSETVHKLLFNDLGFTGLSITDDLAMAAVGDKYANQYLKAFKAGNHILLASDKFANAHSEILNAVEAGNITQAELDKRVFKVLAWKYYNGLLK